MVDIELLRTELIKFGEERIVPYSEKIDSKNEYPRELIEELGTQGFLVPNFESLEPVVFYEVEKWISYFSGSLGLIIDAQAALVSEPIRRFAPDKKDLLEKLSKGQIIGSFALSEPCCGTDTFSVQTRAEKKGDGWEISGKKMWTTQGLYADIFLVAAKTGGEISAFLVNRDKTVSTSMIEVMGCRGTGTSEVTFNATFVPDGMKLGGWEVIRHALTLGRLAIAGMSVGLAMSAFDEAWRWSGEREAFGKKIREHQAIMWQLVDSFTEIEAANDLALKAAEGFFGPAAERLVPMAKLYASNVATRATDRALQVMGGMGYAKGSNVERAYRDSRLMRIGEGTDEAERMIIGKRLEKISGKVWL